MKPKNVILDTVLSGLPASLIISAIVSGLFWMIDHSSPPLATFPFVLVVCVIYDIVKGMRSK